MKALNDFESRDLAEQGGFRRPQKRRDGSSRFCGLPDIKPRDLPEVSDPLRQSLIISVGRKWNNGTVLHYHFLDQPGSYRGSDAEKQVVRDCWQEWKDIGLGLEFREVDDPRDAEIRIGFKQDGRSWSLVGRDAVDHVTDHRRRTMNFGWSVTSDGGRDTALHEIGHALGFYHEHQNPNAGIRWDEQAVRDTFSEPPNSWDDATIDRNILSKRSPEETDGSSWDPNSIMHYPFGPGLILQPEEYRNKGVSPKPGLSDQDKQSALYFYPGTEPARSLPTLERFLSERVNIAAGQQLDFEIIVPANGVYNFMTFGPSDTVLVLFEDDTGERRFVEGDDDAGFDRNARFAVRLQKGRRYILSVRLYFAQEEGSCALVWF